MAHGIVTQQLARFLPVPELLTQTATQAATLRAALDAVGAAHHEPARRAQVIPVPQ